MYDESKEDSSHNFCLDESLEVVKMSQNKAIPLNIRILRKKYNRRRSLSERGLYQAKKQGSTLSQLIGEDTDSSDCTVEERSVRIVGSSKSTSTSVASSSGPDSENEIDDLKSRNNELMVNLMKQRDQIDELENEVEVLVDALKQKEEDMGRVLESNAVNEKRLRQMAVIDSDKWKLTVEIDNLKQVIQEQGESLEKMGLQEQLMLVRRSSTHLINSPEEVESFDNWGQKLQQKIDDLSRVVIEKDNEIKDLTEALQIKELGVMEFRRTVEETHRRQTRVEEELVATSHEADQLRQMASMLQDTVEIRNNELHEMKQKLETEIEVTTILKAEKKMMTEKYEELAQKKVSNDKTFMDLYDELVPGAKVEVPEMDFEENCSDQIEYSIEDRVEGYCYLGFEQSIQTRARKFKPTHAPPPVPIQPVRINNGEKIKTESRIVTENENDEMNRLNEANYEYFLMCSIAVRMNLAEMYNRDEIMTVNSGKLWQVCQISHIPMNKYYFYIEDALREKFGLPKLSYPGSRSERPINAHCCIVM